jgi:hypothetical protein
MALGGFLEQARNIGFKISLYTCFILSASPSMMLRVLFMYPSLPSSIAAMLLTPCKADPVLSTPLKKAIEWTSN